MDGRIRAPQPLWPILVLGLLAPVSSFVNPRIRQAPQMSAVMSGNPKTALGTTASTIQHVVQVELGDRSYPIYIGPGILHDPKLLPSHVLGKKALVVTNDRVGPLYLDATEDVLRKTPRIEFDHVVVPDGEAHKDMETMMMVLDRALGSKLDRKSTFVALGGGVIGDMVGFAAAVYQRGVNFVQVPTTLMAMVDSAVGGKTAVNHPLGKNMIGAFYQPQCVLIDTDTLSTLPDRELASGIAEIVKYGLIRDPELFLWLEENMEKLMNRDSAALAYSIKRSCENKAAIVAMDEREGEAGIRAMLNLGHTFGHAIETGLGYGAWLHGEAVAVGMVMAADLSVRLGWIDDSIRERTVRLLERAKLPVALPKGSGMTLSKFQETMSIDKKVADGVLRLILLKGELGKCVFTADYDVAKLDETIKAFCEESAA